VVVLVDGAELPSDEPDDVASVPAELCAAARLVVPVERLEAVDASSDTCAVLYTPR
jgi:hypothetical protein